MAQSLSSLRYRQDAVSPVIATILLVGITVVLAATLYIMAFGFGGGSTNLPPAASMTKNSISDGFRWTFTPFSKDTTWGDIYIIVTDGTNSTLFNFTTSALTSPSGAITVLVGSHAMGPLTLFVNATDLAGNGYVNQGDSIAITTSGGHFLSIVTYEIDLMDRNSGGLIHGMPFQGD